ncbi:MAG: transposase [Caldisericum sp.]|uniref:transposase n=1 Tax=Caldisericum sp. TaxID=2499687 RepID=UPI003D111D95
MTTEPKTWAYTRTLNTKYGFIDDLRVPRDREGNFRTTVFEPYRRSSSVEILLEKLIFLISEKLLGMSLTTVLRFNLYL